MDLDVQFVPSSTHLAPSDTVVVIDILRMTTTASVLFSKGLAELFVVAEVAEARALASKTGALLLGERGGEKLEGFDGGNSPLEYTQDLTGQSAVLCTSNGSKAVETTSEVNHVFLGAIVNARTVAEQVLKVAKERVALVCAGTGRQVSLDDVLGAVCIARELLQANPKIDLTDAGKVALSSLDPYPGLSNGLQSARHAAILRDLGFEKDIAFAAKLNLLEAVPMRTSQRPTRFTLVPQ